MSDTSMKCHLRTVLFFFFLTSKSILNISGIRNMYEIYLLAQHF